MSKEHNIRMQARADALNVLNRPIRGARADHQRQRQPERVLGAMPWRRREGTAKIIARRPMQLRVLATLLCGALWAQTPPVKPLQPAPRFLRPSNRLMFRPPQSVSVKPNFPAPAPLKPILGGQCAIPLLNADPKGGFNPDPKMVAPAPPQVANIDRMPVVRGLPVCPPVSDKAGR